MDNKLFKPAFEYSLELNPEELDNLDKRVIYEFGVGPGRSFCLMTKVIIKRNLNIELIGVDWWKGLPEEAPGIRIPRETWKLGAYKGNKEEVENKIRELIGECNFTYKLIDKEFGELTEEDKSEKDLIFVNIDCDLYISTKKALRFIRSMLRKNTIIYLDDWYGNDCGEGLALKEFIKENENLKIEFREEQRIAVVNQLI
jgi:hypothetical protein